MRGGVKAQALGGVFVTTVYWGENRQQVWIIRHATHNMVLTPSQQTDV